MTEWQRHLLDEGRKLSGPRALVLLAIHLSLVHHAWGRSTVPWLVPVAALHVAAHVWFSLRRHSVSGALGPARFGVDLAMILAAGTLAGWPDTVQLFGIFVVLTRDELDERRAAVGEAVIVAALGVASVSNGLGLASVVGLVLAAGFGHFGIARRMRLVAGLVNELADREKRILAAQQRLTQAHGQALANEKLSSLGLLAAGVAHEINNPMSYVSSNINQLLEDLKARPNLDAVLREYTDDVLPATLKGIARVNRIVADLRYFAKGDPAAMIEYDVNEQVRVATRIVRGLVTNDSNLRLDLRELPRAVGFPGQIVRVLVNLMVNAAQSYPETGSGPVHVTTELSGEHVKLSVMDHGRGMTPELRAHLFEPFFTTRPVGQGTGTGLSATWGIVRAHRGHIDVESDEGGGSTFVVWLPLQPGLARLAEAEVSADRVSPPQLALAPLRHDW